MAKTVKFQDPSLDTEVTLELTPTGLTITLVNVGVRGHFYTGRPLARKMGVWLTKNIKKEE